MLASVRAAERAFGLPSPTIGGVPTKLSPETRGNYLFTDLTPANADETIRLAKLGGFKNILVYVSTWSQTAGTYAINTRHYPGGEAELRTVIDKCHRAGLGVGMHLVSSMIGKGDPLVRPTPDPRLLLDSHATLASPIGPGDATMSLSGALADFPTDGAFYGNVKGGRDVRIGDEIVQYQSIDVAGNRLLGCTRGFAGTQAVAHPAGAHVGHLAERYGSYLANLRTNLLPQLANRISGLINRCGFDMVYFDGGENSPEQIAAIVS